MASEGVALSRTLKRLLAVYRYSSPSSPVTKEYELGITLR